MKPKLVSVRGSTAEQIATKSKIDRFLTAWEENSVFVSDGTEEMVSLTYYRRSEVEFYGEKMLCL